MVYSNRKIPNDPTLFPEPQHWMAWVAEIDYSQMGMTGKRILKSIPDQGKLKHYHTLAEAKKALMWIGRKSRGNYAEYYENVGQGNFITDWAVYEWVGDQWVKRYEGFVGEKRADNPLFKRKFKADEKANPIDRKLEDQAIASILGVA